jgi:hypothetical protein
MLDNSPTLLDPLKRLPAELFDEGLLCPGGIECVLQLHVQFTHTKGTPAHGTENLNVANGVDSGFK